MQIILLTIITIYAFVFKRFDYYLLNENVLIRLRCINKQVGTVIGGNGGNIYYSGNPFCVSTAIEDKWHVSDNVNWQKDSTMKISCKGNTIVGLCRKLLISF